MEKYENVVEKIYELMIFCKFIYEKFIVKKEYEKSYFSIKLTHESQLIHIFKELWIRPDNPINRSTNYPQIYQKHNHNTKTHK